MEIQPEKREDCRENDLSFDFSKAEMVIKLDGQDHGLSHCLKAVDFVVEWSDQFWLIEIKDPENSTIPAEKKEQEERAFYDRLQSGKLMNDHLIPKFRDSLIYLGLDRGIPAKPMRYLVLITLSSLDDLLLSVLKEIFPKQDGWKWVGGPKQG